MSHKYLSGKFVEIIQTGTIAMIYGIGALATLSQNLAIACLTGIVGIAIGIATLRMSVEKWDKMFAAIGMALSIASVIYATVTFIQK